MRKVFLLTFLALAVVGYAKAQRPTNGFKVFAEAGIAIRTPRFIHEPSEQRVADYLEKSLDLTVTGGYQFNKTLIVGLGTGLSYALEPKSTLIPLFADFRFTLSRSSLAPFIGLKSGYVFGLDSGLYGYVMLCPSFGVKVYHNLYATLGYNFQWAKGEDASYNEFSGQNQSIEVKLGWNF